MKNMGSLTMVASGFMGKDWILLTIAAARGESLSPVQLQKSLFLIERNLTGAQRRTRDFYKFTPYDYGPFDSTIYRDAGKLESEGYVSIIQTGNGSYREYAATPDGLRNASELRQQLDEVALDYLDRVVEWTRKLSFGELVSSIYKAYPEMAVNSVFRG
jgi:uncharacterized protein